MHMGWFSILTSQKIMAQISNHQSLLQPHDLMQFWQITWEYHPNPTHFHVHLCNNLHIVSQHPHDPAPQMLPHGKCAKLLSNFAIFLPHLKAFTPHHSEAYHAQPPKHFQAPSLCSHFRPLHSQW